MSLPFVVSRHGDHTQSLRLRSASKEHIVDMGCSSRLVEISMNTESKQTARLAGLLYLALGITGAFGIMYIPTSVVVPTDIAATIKNMVNNQTIFKLSIVSNWVSQTIFIFLGLTLYRLFRDVDIKNARLMISLVLVSVPIAFLNTLNQIIALNLSQDDQSLIAFSRYQLDTMALFFLNLNNDGIAIAQIFWGLWLFPFGMLVIRSGFIPKLIGYLLIVACFGYLANTTAHFLTPNYMPLVAPATAVIGTVAEFSAILWLLIKGVREQKAETTPKDEKKPTTSR